MIRIRIERSVKESYVIRREDDGTCLVIGGVGMPRPAWVDENFHPGLIIHMSLEQAKRAIEGLPFVVCPTVEKSTELWP